MRLSLVENAELPEGVVGFLVENEAGSEEGRGRGRVSRWEMYGVQYVNASKSTNALLSLPPSPSLSLPLSFPSSEASSTYSSHYVFPLGLAGVLHTPVLGHHRLPFPVALHPPLKQEFPIAQGQGHVKKLIDDVSVLLRRWQLFRMIKVGDPFRAQGGVQEDGEDLRNVVVDKGLQIEGKKGRKEKKEEKGKEKRNEGGMVRVPHRAEFIPPFFSLSLPHTYSLPPTITCPLKPMVPLLPACFR